MRAVLLGIGGLAVGFVLETAVLYCVMRLFDWAQNG